LEVAGSAISLPFVFLVRRGRRGGGANQRWTFQPVSGNVFTVRSVGSGLCLDVPGSSTAEGVQLDQWTCDGGANQEWVFDAAGNYSSPSDTSFVLVSLNTGMTAEVKGNSTASGAKVDQWQGNGGSNQTWAVSAA